MAVSVTSRDNATSAIGVVLHAKLQSSTSTAFASSHCSPACTTPSPHAGSEHALVHASSSTWLPSSQPSPGSTTASPQIAAPVDDPSALLSVVDPPLVVLVLVELSVLVVSLIVPALVALLVVPALVVAPLVVVVVVVASVVLALQAASCCIPRKPSSTQGTAHASEGATSPRASEHQCRHDRPSNIESRYRNLTETPHQCAMNRPVPGGVAPLTCRARRAPTRGARCPRSRWCCRGRADR
ncbi:MAG: hypothetical protein IPO88_13060 [Nannocystis sp.]|nr:hypothetical protein [Nannocystis sp.]